MKRQNHWNKNVRKGNTAYSYFFTLLLTTISEKTSFNGKTGTKDSQVKSTPDVIFLNSSLSLPIISESERRAFALTIHISSFNRYFSAKTAFFDTPTLPMFSAIASLTSKFFYLKF